MTGSQFTYSTGIFEHKSFTKFKKFGAGSFPTFGTVQSLKLYDATGKQYHQSGLSVLFSSSLTYQQIFQLNPFYNPVISIAHPIPQKLNIAPHPRIGHQKYVDK
jgi:hypothetical protein